MSLESAADQIIDCCCEALLAGVDNLWLATVVSTWGSSPRPPGAMMLWSPALGTLGSVSGGCVEEDLLDNLKRGNFERSRPHTLTYGGPHSHRADLVLPCGGELTLVLEPLSLEHLDEWLALQSRLRARQSAERKVALSTGLWTCQPARQLATSMLADTLTVVIGPTRKLLIIGANQIAHFLVEIAHSLDFEVTVCDPGEDIGTYWGSMPCRLVQRFPDGLIDQEFRDPRCAVVAVSHDPRLDDMALLEALDGSAFYVGAMGSVKSSLARRQRLASLGVTDLDLARLQAPIGLPIGSKTPAEIALSIAADLVKNYQLGSD